MEYTINLKITVDETEYTAPSEWRMAGAKTKADNIMQICSLNNITPQKILEVGAGEGSILQVLSNKAFSSEYHALEISQSGVNVIKERGITGLTSCQTFDGYHIPFKDDEFDLIILSHVLEHVEYERALLREIFRVAKYAVIEVPLDNVPDSSPNKSLLPSYGHINIYTPDMLKFLLHTENFHVIDESLTALGYEVELHLYFANKEKTDESFAQFKDYYEKKSLEFKNCSHQEKEKRSLAYTVLTRKITQEDLLALYSKDCVILLKNNNKDNVEMITNSLANKISKPVLLEALINACINSSLLTNAEHFIEQLQQFSPDENTITNFKERIIFEKNNPKIEAPLPEKSVLEEHNTLKTETSFKNRLKNTFRNTIVHTIYKKIKR